MNNSKRRKAYDANKSYRENLRFRILDYLHRVKPTATSADLLDALGGANSGVTPRLRELEMMGLVCRIDEGRITPSHQPADSYRLTKTGKTVAQLGNEGRYLMVAISPTISELNEDRAVDLKPLKDIWEQRERAVLRNKMDELLDQISPF